ncbi:MAG: response regulator [Chthoniobacterales bacterium]|nr:response regulator [Chthoniobacterales bacterium]
MVIPFAAETRRSTVSPRPEPKEIHAIPFSPNWLPVPEASPSSKVASAPVGRSRSPEDAQTLPVIVAEDDPVSRMLVCTLLEKWGYRVIVTHDGREAMEAIRAQITPALAVIDWMMPGFDGIEICQRVREANNILYIILLTARGGKERLIEGLEAGADDYLM